MFFLIAKDNEWAGLLSSLDMFSDDLWKKDGYSLKYR